jgi:hypothetical protein
MDDTGADARPMREFLANVCEQGGPLQNIFDLAVAVGAPQAAAEHMRDTMKLAISGDICEVGAVFTFGREDIIPHMFSQILQGGCLPAGETKIFKYYLERHIELDGDEHAPPLAIRLVESLCNDKCGARAVDKRWEMAAYAVQQALRKRAALWESVQRCVRQAVAPDWN